MFDEEHTVSTESLVNSVTESHANSVTESLVNSVTESLVNSVKETNSNKMTNYLIGFTISLLIFVAMIIILRRAKLFSKFKAKKKVKKRFRQKNLSPLSYTGSIGSNKHFSYNSRMKGSSKYFSNQHSLKPSSIQNRTTHFITSSQQLSDEPNLASRNYSWSKQQVSSRSTPANLHSAKERINLNIRK